MAPDVHSLLSIQTTLPGRVLAERDRQPLARRVAELGVERLRLVAVKDVEGDDVRRERVARQNTLVEQAVEQVRLAARFGRQVPPPSSPESPSSTSSSSGAASPSSGSGSVAVWLEVEGLVDLAQRSVVTSSSRIEWRSFERRARWQPGVNIGAERRLVLVQPLLEVGCG